MVLHRPVELAALIRHVNYFRMRRQRNTIAKVAGMAISGRPSSLGHPDSSSLVVRGPVLENPIH